MRWVRLELGNGVLDGRRLINADALDAARQPQAASGKSPSGKPQHYGYGWVLEHDSDGILRISQSGAFRGCLRSFHAEASRLSMMRMAAILIRVSDVCTIYS
jgi:CubicO group peptidase (beta-lactamase class C family)